MAEPHDRSRTAADFEPAVSCLLCGEPTVGTIQAAAGEPFSAPEYACCPACAYGVEERELHGLLRVMACGPN